MPKPFRTKREGKEIGSFKVRVRGHRVNLKTKDPSEARRRARLANDGRWPPEAKAADDMKEILDGVPPVPGEGDLPAAEATPIGQGGDPGSPPEASHFAPPADSAPPDVVSEVNAAAADVAGAAPPAAGVPGVPMTPEEIDRAFTARLLQKFGVEQSEAGGTASEAGQFLARLRAGVVRQGVDWWANRQTPPRHLNPESKPDDFLGGIEALAWEYVVLQHAGALPALSPGWVLLGIGVLDLLAVSRDLQPGPSPTPAPEPPASPSS
jgi:hypothetical protein